MVHVYETAFSDDCVRGAIITTNVKVSPYEDIDKACYMYRYQ